MSRETLWRFPLVYVLIGSMRGLLSTYGRERNCKLATVQIDLDGWWVLLQFLGHSVERDHDPLFESGLPRVLDLLDRYQIRATFFVNAIDLKDRRRRELVERVTMAGHELANHGLNHAYFSRLPSGEKVRHIAESSQILCEFSGQLPRGFRAPGYDMDGEGLSLLQDRGYLYDSSAFPTSVSPLLSLFQRLLAGRSQTSYPWLAQLFAPCAPYRPVPGRLYRGGGTGIMEIPVTVLPMLRLPLNFSYGALLGAWYFRLGLRWALKAGAPVNFLFHLVDFADPILDPRFRRVPGVRLPLARRLALADGILRFLQQRTEILPTAELCGRLSHSADPARV